MVLEKLLKNKVCVVTGGGRGIGAAIAEKFAGQGASLILTARSEDQLQEVMSVRFFLSCNASTLLPGHVLWCKRCMRSACYYSAIGLASITSRTQGPAVIKTTITSDNHMHLMHDAYGEPDTQVAKSCEAKGAASCEIHAVDLSQPDAVESFAKAVLNKHKRVDVLVNNAGVGLHVILLYREFCCLAATPGAEHAWMQGWALQDRMGRLKVHHSQTIVVNTVTNTCHTRKAG